MKYTRHSILLVSGAPHSLFDEEGTKGTEGSKGSKGSGLTKTDASTQDVMASASSIVESR
jgi:hypothetical protein